MSASRDHGRGRGAGLRAADRAVPRGGHRVRLPRLHPLPRARPQGRRRSRPRPARPRSATGRCCSTCPRTSRGSTSDRRRPRTSAPSSSPPRPTAPGATWFLTNGASQGNHALCLALAPPGRRVVLQRNSHASLIDGLVLSGGLAQLRRPRVRRRARHGPRRRRRGARAGAAPRARRAVAPSSSRPPTTGWRPTSRGAPRWPIAPARAHRRQRVGRAFRLSPRAARVAAASSAPTR